VSAAPQPARSDPRFIRAAQLYKELSANIEPYRTLKETTGEFNRLVRELHKLGLQDAEYVGLRLDAHHIVENTWYSTYSKQFERAFGWRSGGDMDAIAIHTELHIRSGDRMAENLQLLGAEGHSSLTKILHDFLERERMRVGGRFRSLHELFDAHERFYRQELKTYWPRLQNWFDLKRAKVRAVSA
jgi:hypothetical protein